MKRIRSLTGQELVEFALILPIMVVILVAISEMGFMWTLRGTVSDAIKSSVQRMQALAGSTPATIEAQLETSIKSYLTSHGVPNANSADITLINKAGSNYSTIEVAYTYNPAFTLPNFFGIQLLPDSIVMHSSQVVNAALLQQNNYAAVGALPGALTLGSPTSILGPTVDVNARKQMAFVVHYGTGDIDQVVNWWGHSIFPPSTAINLKTGTMWVRSPYKTGETPDANNWEDTHESYVPVMLANGYTTMVYVNGTTAVSPSNKYPSGYAEINTDDLGFAPGKWCTSGGGTCDQDLSGVASGTNLLVDSVAAMGDGYDVLAPAPATTSGIEPVGTVPTGFSIPDNVYRDIMSRFKMYIPKSIRGDGTGSGDFKTPTISNADIVNLQNTPEVFASRVSDMDGDGISDYFDKDPAEADADRDGAIDGYQTHTAGTGIEDSANYQGNYSSGGALGGKNGYIPQANVDTSAGVANGTFLTVSGSTEFANKTCADSGCNDATKPFFVRIKSAGGEYVNPSGKTVSIPGGYSAAEKYYTPDASKKIYNVEVVTRDNNNDGTVQMANPYGGACLTFGDDDGNNDCINDGSLTDTKLGHSFGLIFVQGTNGGKSFTSVAGKTQTQGYATLGGTATQLDASALDAAIGRFAAGKLTSRTDN